MSTTYSNIYNKHSVKAVCTTGSETAPTTSATDGLDLQSGTNGRSLPVARYEVRVYPTSGAASLTAGTLDFYAYIKTAAAWGKLLNSDGTQVQYTVPASGSAGLGFSFVASEAHGVDRVTCIPTGLGVACTIEIIGTPRNKGSL